MSQSVMVALSGGVDSAVAALELVGQGYDVECLHMTNWEDDDGYCQAAADFQDARRTSEMIGVPLHRVNFSSEYHHDVFTDFLAAHQRGETPNPDVMCNRHIKFGVMQRYARRLGADWLATGHYARVDRSQTTALLGRARDSSKDQTYFLHAIASGALDATLFPLGEMTKQEVRTRARKAGLAVAEKRDSTGICFIGERPFADFLSRYIADSPGAIVTVDGERLGTHRGLAFYTLGQRQGLDIGGRSGFPAGAWYVAEKRSLSNELVVVQNRDHPLLYQDWMVATDLNWIGPAPPGLSAGATVRATAKTRYRQPDQPCIFRQRADGELEVEFDEPQRAVTPGQYVVLYAGERCLGGARIVTSGLRKPSLHAAV